MIIQDWLDERTGWRTLKLVLLDRKIPKVNWSYVLGSVSLFLILLQALTGIFLAMNYSPSPDHAYDSVRYIMGVPSGAFLRGLHAWGASALVASVLLHMARIFFMGSYKYPREGTWLTGVFLLFMILAFDFTGYLLPWDQKAYSATVVGTNIAEQAGKSIGSVLRGGSDVGAITLTRFYAIHVLLLPFLTFLLMGSHLFLVVWHGISSLPERMKGWVWSNDWKQEVQSRYYELKGLGKPFFPYIVFKDMVAIALVFAWLVALSVYKGADLETMADPTDTTSNPRPEWPFLFLFQLLKYIPPQFETVAVVIIPAVIVSFLILLPFLDRGPKRHPFDRPFIIGLGVIGITGAVYLGIQGYLSPLTNPIVEKNVQVIEGKRLFTDMRCQSCHSIGGRGGMVGPVLDMVGSRRDKEWLTEHFRNPQKMFPGSQMPNFGLLGKEIEALAVYMSSLSGGSFTSEAPALFQEHCSSCHKIGDVGEDLGPDLSQVGLHYEQEWLARYIAHPEKIEPKTAMEVYADILTPEQIEDLARYLSAQCRVAPKK